MAENPKDYARSILTLGINTTDTTLQLSNTLPYTTARFGTSGDYTVVLRHTSTTDFELIRISGRSGDNLSVASGGRGFGNPVTTPNTWPAGTLVEVVLDVTTILNMLSAVRTPGVVHNGNGNPNGSGTNITPNTTAGNTMTSNSSPSPFVASSSGNFPSYEPYKAFDAIAANSYWIGSPATPSWLEIDLGSNSIVVDNYAVMVNDIPEPTRAPKDWTLEGSNDHTTWNVIDTVTNQTTWTSGQERSFTCDVTTTAYRYYRLYITANNGDASFTQVARVYLFGPSTPFTGAINGDWYIDLVPKALYGPYNGSWSLYALL